MEDSIRKELKRIYNNHAHERNASNKQDWKIKSRKIFLDHLKSFKLNSLLEIGAGTGQDSLFFMENNIDVTAIDLSEENVRYCKEQGVKAKVMDLYNLEFPDKSFDSIYSLNCLLHIPKSDIDFILDEIKRVMKKNGLFYLGVYGGRDFEGKNEKDNYPEKRFFSFYKFEDYQRILANYFEIIISEKINLEKNFEFHYYILKKLV